jgi:hypothetical protein
MWYPARLVSGVPLVFSVGAVQDRLAEPVVGLAGGAGAAGGEATGTPAAVAVAEAGDTPTPSPQAVRSSPANTSADIENSALEGLIVGMPQLNYGCLVRAICRSLRT